MRRAIEEGNGSADAFANSTVFLQRVIGEAADGSKGAADSLAAIGLSYEDLIDLAPEEAFIKVAGATNELGSQSASTAAKAGLLGGGYRELGAFVNQTEAEIRAQTEALAENAVVMSDDQVTAVDGFDAASRKLRDTFSGITTNIGSALIPLMTKLIDGVSAAIPILKDTFAPIWDALQEIWIEMQPALAGIGDTLVNDLLPALQDIWNAISPVLIPVIKVLISLLFNNLKTAFGVISGSISLVASLLTGDFAGAWESVKKIAVAVMNGIITVYNNTIALIPGVSKIDMVEFADNVETASDSVDKSATKAKDALVGSNGKGGLIKGTADVSTASDKLAKALKESSKDIVDDSKDRTKKLLADYAAEVAAIGDRLRAEEQDKIDRAAANKTFREDELEASKTAWGITDVEYGLAQASLETISSDKYAELIEQAGGVWH